MSLILLEYRLVSCGILSSSFRSRLGILASLTASRLTIGCLVHDLFQLCSVVDIPLNLKVTILDVECILGVDLNWHVVLLLCFLPLCTVVKVQHLLPHVLIISIARQVRALDA